MSVIDQLQTFQGLGSSELKYQMANDIALDYLGFSIQSHYFDRMYGVMSGALESEGFGDFVVNTCIREALWRGLFDVQAEVERRVGFNLSPRYHTQTLAFPFRDHVKLSWPGIEVVDVESTWVDLELTASVSPFVILAATIVNGTGNPIIAMDREFVSNPHDVILRKSDTLGAYTMMAANLSYPKRVGSDWQVQMDGNLPSYDSGEDVSVQHRKYAYVEVTIPEDVTGEVFPVYPGTTQIIPQAKPYEDLGDGSRRYWFYIWTLVDPAFYDTTVDLVRGEFYKLYEEIAFKERREATFKGRLEQRCPDNCQNCSCCTDHNYQVTTKLVDASRGIVSFEVDGELVVNEDTQEEELVTTNCRTCLQPDGCSIYTLSIAYKTNPEVLPVKFKAAIPELLRAVLSRVAAELPLKDCLCEIRDGFIFDMQRSYGTIIRTPGGDTLMSNKFGEKHGQRVYLEIMENAPAYKVTKL